MTLHKDCPYCNSLDTWLTLGSTGIVYYGCRVCKGQWDNIDLTSKQKQYDEVGAIMAYESGELDKDGCIELFQHLVDNGHAWSLQGSYGRTARALIDAGYVTEKK